MTLLLSLFACQAGVAVGDAEVSDFADETDTAAANDSGVEAIDTADTGEAAPVFATDFSAYEGTRNFYADIYGYYECNDTITEWGVQLTSGSEYDALVEACPACTYFYENTPEVDSVCDGYLALGVTYRAILLTENGGIAYFYSAGDDGMDELGSDNSYGWDGESVGTYDYEFSFYGFPVAASGTMTFAWVETP